MDKRPNILWLCTDQQRWDTIHALGNSFIDTPNLDRLCRQGVAFTNTYCQNPICTPSRASFLTGRYPSSINANINGACNLPEHCTLITKRLADAGYYCGLVGKLHITSAWNDYEPRMDDCCFSKRMRKVFRKNEKSMLQNCNKKAKRKGRLQRVKKPM